MAETIHSCFYLIAVIVFSLIKLKITKCHKIGLSDALIETVLWDR